MKLNIERSVTVLTPSIGSPKLADAIRSVQAQTYTNVKHIIVADGHKQYADKMMEVVMEAIPGLPSRGIQTTSIPENTGKTGGDFYGHRIYAGYPHFLNSDYVFFLDEDNWYEPDHVKTLVEVLDRGFDFAYSFRKIFTPDKEYVCDDNCEALGKWPIFLTHDNPQFLIDTSSFAFRCDFIQASCNLWHSGWGGDRRYFYSVKDHCKWEGSMKHTLCYRLDGNEGSVTKDFFIQGNQKQLEIYKGNLPWLNH